jgi:4-amino-4-deoxy-L-arabinose transferase-like glycosyltransferase
MDPTPTALLPTELPPKWPVRVGLALTTLLYLVYSSFGIAAPFWWGHHGYHGATYMLRARMSLRFHMLAPATFTGYDFPTKDAFYFHHPIGYHHILTVLVPIFGEHEWLARAVAVVGGLFTMWALYSLVKRMWSREAGLVAVLVYVLLPVIVSFSVLSDPMLLEMACVLWGLDCYFSLLQKPTWRALWMAAAAYFLGGLLMWEVFFIGPFVAAHALFYSMTRKGSVKLGRFNAARLHIWFIGFACVAAMGFHIWFTAHAGMWADFLDSYRIRHSPPSAPYVIERHTLWMDLLYGRTPILFSAMWFVLWLARVASGRARLRDLAPLTILYVNTLYIYMFAEGSSVHLYRVFFYSGFFALAVTDLVDDAFHAARRLWPRPHWSGVAAGLAVLSAYLFLELPHTYHNWIDSRVLMGTHGEGHYDPEQHKLLFAKDVTKKTKPDERVIIHYGQLGARKEMWYYLDRSFDNINSLSELDKYKKNFAKSWLILDEHALAGYDRTRFEELITQHPVTFYDRYTLIDLRTDKPLVSSYAFGIGNMSRGYKWWISHKYAPLRLFRTGYLPGICTAIEHDVPIARDEDAAPWPTDLKQLQCYRNYLVLRGETREAERAQERLLEGLEAKSAPLSTARVIAAGRVGGKVKVAILTEGPLQGDVRYVIRNAKGDIQQVVNRGALPPPAKWRERFLYVDELAIGSGELSVELVEPPKPLVTLPPGRFTPRWSAWPTPPPIVTGRADLGKI